MAHFSYFFTKRGPPLKKKTGKENSVLLLQVKVRNTTKISNISDRAYILNMVVCLLCLLFFLLQKNKIYSKLTNCPILGYNDAVVAY